MFITSIIYLFIHLVQISALPVRCSSFVLFLMLFSGQWTRLTQLGNKSRITLDENPEKSAGQQRIREGVTSWEIGDESGENMWEIFLSLFIHDISHLC